MLDEKELSNLSDERLRGRIEGSGDVLIMIDDLMQQEKDNGILENLRHDVCEYLRSHLRILKDRNKDEVKKEALSLQRYQKVIEPMVNPTSYLTLTRNDIVTLPDSLKSELQSGLDKCNLSVLDQSVKTHPSQIASVFSEYLMRFIEDNNLTSYNLSTEVEVSSILKDDILNLDITLPEWVLTGVLKYRFYSE